MRLVVDASVSVKWLVPEEGSDAALTLTTGEHELHAPRLMAAELANALWSKARRGQMEHGKASALMASVSGMPVQWHADEAVGADAVRLALAFDKPVYDFMYLALAQRIGATVVTADRRFANAVAPTAHGGAVMTLAEYASGG